METNTNQASGSQTFPCRGCLVPSRKYNTPGVVILHRLSNASSSTGAYYCEIPDGAGINKNLCTPGVKVYKLNTLPLTEIPFKLK